MSEETASPSATALPNQTTPDQNKSEAPANKPSLEDAFAAGGKSKLSKNLTRPKKLGASSFNEGADDLSGTSKKAKKASPKEDQVLFDAPTDTEKEVSLFDKKDKPEFRHEKTDMSKKDEKINTKPEEKPEAALPKKYKVK